MSNVKKLPSAARKPRFAGASNTTPIDNRERKNLRVKSGKMVIVFFIGGAGDKESFYGTGPYRNIYEVQRMCEEPFNELIKSKLYHSEYLGYDEVCGRNDVKANVVQKIRNLSMPIYIIGHSLGGWNGAHLSSILTDLGYSVEMLITLDPVGAGLVKLAADIYFSEPKPKAKFWINLRAEAKSFDASDRVARAGSQWMVKNGPNLNYIAPIHHAEAGKKFLVRLGKQSAWDYFYSSIVRLTSP